MSLIEFLLRLPTKGFDWVMFTLLWMLLAMLVVLLFVILYKMVDELGVERIKGYGKIDRKLIDDARSTISFIPAGRGILIPITSYHKKKYKLKVEISGKITDVEVSKKMYKRAERGLKVTICYSMGRISNFPFIRVIKL